jgi:flagellar hook-length control protein FliK
MPAPGTGPNGGQTATDTGGGSSAGSGSKSSSGSGGDAGPLPSTIHPTISTTPAPTTAADHGGSTATAAGPEPSALHDAPTGVLAASLDISARAASPATTVVSAEGSVDDGVPLFPDAGEQLVAVLDPLRSGPDGVHEVTLALQPEGLGTVKATVSVGPQEVVVHLSADTSHGEEAIRQALPDLREHLGQGQDHPATVLLSDGGHERRGGDGPGSPATARDASAATVRGVPGATSGTDDGERLVDLRL